MDYGLGKSTCYIAEYRPKSTKDVTVFVDSDSLLIRPISYYDSVISYLVLKFKI